jgi:general secretion pathway protein G
MKTKRKQRSARGLGLIEIVVYITIVAMLMSAVAVYAIGVHQNARIDAARLDLKNAEAALDMYLASKGRYPDPADGFAPMVKIRALKKVPKDPWGNDLFWEMRDGVPVVWSYGADGVKGGVDQDADLSSADVEE